MPYCVRFKYLQGDKRLPRGYSHLINIADDCVESLTFLSFSNGTKKLSEESLISDLNAPKSGGRCYGLSRRGKLTRRWS